MTAMSDADVVPDTKDWTWVLEQPCAECGFVAQDVEPTAVAGLLRDNAEQWRAVLGRPSASVRRRPAAGVSSPLEYGCHVRDVHRTMHGRVLLVLEQDDPVFPNWDQDATAVAERYVEQDPAVVADELVAASAAAAGTYEQVAGAAWDRPGLRDNGSRFTVATLGRYHLHDVVHHLRDVRAG